MPATITIVTPENVEITYELAGIGSRALAATVDMLIHALGLVALIYAVNAASELGIRIPEALRPWLLAATIIILFGIFWSYHIFFETRWSGQSPGKRVVRLRVIKDGGYPIDFRASVARNLMRYADFLPAFYALGVISIFFSHDYKRLGDFVAGTLVVREDRAAHRRGRDPLLSLSQPLPEPLAAPSEPPPFDVSRLTRADYRALRHYLDRRDSLPAAVRERLAVKLAGPLRTRLSWHTGSAPDDPNAFLETVAHWYEQKHGG